MSEPARKARLRGIALMIAAVGVFSVMDATMKQLTGHYSPMQVVSLRGLSSLPFVLLPLALTGRWHQLRPIRPGLHLVRGVLAVAMLWGIVWAFAHASMTDTYAVTMSAPLLIVAVAAVLLGERVDAHRWAAILAGLVGVLVILKPSAGAMVSLAGLAALASALAYAFAAVTIRVLARTDSTPAMVFWFLFLVALGAGAIAAPEWTGIRAGDWRWLLLMGLCGWAGQHLITEAFRLAPASLIAPFEYTALLWALGIDWLAWQTLPSARVLAGAAIVGAGGLYLYLRTRIAGRA